MGIQPKCKELNYIFGVIESTKKLVRSNQESIDRNLYGATAQQNIRALMKRDEKCRP